MRLQLARMNQRHGLIGKTGKKSVIITAAKTDAKAFFVKNKAWNNEQIDGLLFNFYCFFRFRLKQVKKLFSIV